MLPGVVASSPDPPADHQACAGESLFQVLDSIDRDRTGRRLAFVLAALHQSTAANVPRRRRQAHRHAVPQTTIRYPARPVRELGPAGSAPALRAGVSGRRRAGLCPTETLRPPLPGSKPRPCSGPAPPSRAGPDTAPASYRSGARASACSRRCVPARLGNAVSLTRRCLHLRPTEDQGTARVNGQGKRPGI